MEIRYGEIKNLPIREAVRGIVIKDDQIGVANLKTLDFMMLPGGGVDPGEDLETALIREMEEEAGIQVKIQSKLMKTIRDEDTWCHVNHIYICEVVDDTLDPILTEQEIWLNLSFEYVSFLELYKHYIKSRTIEMPLDNPLILDYIKSREILVLNQLLRKKLDFSQLLKEWINEQVEIVIDRPINEDRPVNYGYLEQVFSLDGKEMDAYVLCEETLEVGTRYLGTVIGVVHRLNDVEDKLIVSTQGYTMEQMKKLTNHYEKYFDSIYIGKED